MWTNIATGQVTKSVIIFVATYSTCSPIRHDSSRVLKAVDGELERRSWSGARGRKREKNKKLGDEYQQDAARAPDDVALRAISVEWK